MTPADYWQSPPKGFKGSKAQWALYIKNEEKEKQK